MRLIRLLPLFLAFAFFGCGKEMERHEAALGSGELRWASFPVEVYVDAFLLSDSDAKADLEDAIGFWENRAGKPLFRVIGSWDAAVKPFTGEPQNPDELLGNVLFFQSPWPFDTRIAGKTILHSSNSVIENSIILLNGETHLCANSCRGEADSVSRRKLLAHELGHFLGLGHSNEMLDIMYPEILPGGSLDHLEVNTVLLQRLTN